VVFINNTQYHNSSRLKIRFSPLGIHIFSRDKGINILLDEIRLPQNIWAKAPRQISIALTNICDLSCSYCFAPKNYAILNQDLVRKWIIELDSNGCIGVGFGGGEPTFYPQFPELCKYIAKKTSLAITFTTHAHRLDENFLKSIQGNVHFVRVSMDGIGETYEMLRGRPFSVLCDHLENLRYLVPFGINFVVNKQTFPDLDAAINLAEMVGASEFLLLPEHPINGCGGIDNITEQALLHWVTQYQGGIPLTISEFGTNVLQYCNPLPEEIGLQAYAHIDANGILKRTSYDIQGVVIGPEGVIEASHRLLQQMEN
jgi:sulfatase maturation enzyme AslB (radical SAM superfamily)